MDWNEDNQPEEIKPIGKRRQLKEQMKLNHNTSEVEGILFINKFAERCWDISVNTRI